MKRERNIYSSDLGIDLASGKESEIFKWFLACLLFGKPIQQEVARRTYLEFEKEGLTSPDAIIEAGWDKLVEVLDRGHYVRFDYSTATKLLEVCKSLTEQHGTLTNMLQQAKTVDELQMALQRFKGIGPVTARIFLRDITPVWSRLSQAVEEKWAGCPGPTNGKSATMPVSEPSGRAAARAGRPQPTSQRAARRHWGQGEKPSDQAERLS